MSWQQGQLKHGPVATWAPMLAAVFAASQKPLAEEALREAMRGLEAVPDDINWQAFQAGVVKYQQAQQGGASRSPHPEIGRAGRVTLRDAGGDGPVVVLVPSMVNRGYVLDLCEGHSLVQYLRQAGFHVLLIDWGEAGVDEDGPLDLEAVVAGRLVPLLEKAAEINSGPVAVFGYCMGGTLSVAAAAVVGKEVVGKLALGAMPWDFQATASAQHMQMGRPMLEPWVGTQSVIPPAVMQQYFWMLDPWSPVRRLMAYGQETDPARLAHMTALEDWLWDGLALDGPVAREMLFDWYADNKPLKGEWTAAGKQVNPADLSIPLWVAVTQRDVLVPTASSLPFVAQTKGAQVITAETGHVGLVCGRHAEARFYRPLATWLQGVQSL